MNINSLISTAAVATTLSAIPVCSGSSSESKIEPPASAPAMEQRDDAAAMRFSKMRWPLADTTGIHRANGYPERQQAIGEEILGLFNGTGGSKQAIVAKLEAHLAEMKAQGRDFSLISEEGPGPDRASPLLDLREMAFDHALLWGLTNDPAAARQSKAILLRFAKVVRHWPLYDRQKKEHTQDDETFLRHWTANGLWGRWHPLDLAVSVPLLRAYDLIRPTLSTEERETIENDLFLYHKAQIDRYGGLVSNYSNLSGYHLIALCRFGQVLEKPEFIHQVVDYWRKQLDYSYAPDGFFRQVTPSYHTQITSRLSNVVPAILKGYSDPEGYRYPETGERFDNLDLRTATATRLATIDRALDVFRLPDGSVAHFNDSWPGTQQRHNDPASHQPGLLGISGIAKISSGGMAAVIKFGGIRGHDHRDALGLVWHAGGREVFSDTGYKSKPEMDIHYERSWGASTASHQTAAINEQIHFDEDSRPVVPSPKRGNAFASDPPEVPGSHPVEATLPAAARFLNQGRLLIWDGRHAGAQAIEAEQPGAYPGVASLFRRTVVMLPEGEGEGILVEIFRMDGGTTHDYFLRGDLGSPYTMAFDQTLQPASGDHYTYVNLERAGSVQPPLKATVRYEDGLQVDSRLSMTSTGGNAGMSVLLGSAPAIRRPGNATFSTIRRTAAATSPELKSDFVWVHEAHRGKARIQSVQAQRIGTGVHVKVEREGRTDHLFSGDDESSHFELEGWRFTGRLAHASTQAGKTSGTVFSGSDLRQDGTIAKGSPSLAGKLIGTTRMEAGDATHSLLVELEDPSDFPTGFHLAHIDLNENIRFSIPVKTVTREGERRVRVELSHSPGLEQKEGFGAMTNFPGWRVSGEAQVRVE